jgi:hypothetical protein
MTFSMLILIKKKLKIKIKKKLHKDYT